MISALRPGPILLGAGGALWFAWGVLALAGSGSYDCKTVADVSGDILFFLAGGITAIGLVQLGAVVQGGPRLASFVLSGGMTVLVLGNLVEHCAFSDAWLIFVLGATITFLAGAALGITLFLRWSAARYLGVIVLLGSLAPGILANNGGFAAYGLAWLAFAILWGARVPEGHLAGHETA